MRDRREEIDSVVEYVIKHYNYGDIIEYKKLEKLIGLTREEIGFAYLLAVVKEELIELGIVTTSVINEGLRILHPKEIAGFIYQRYAKGGLMKFEKGLKIMQYIDRTKLNQEEKEKLLSMEKIVAEMYRESENNLLKAQVLIGEKVKKELTD